MVGANFKNNLLEIPSNLLLFFFKVFLLFLVLFVHRYRLIQTCNFVFSSGSVQSFFDPCKLYYLPGLSQYL